MGFPCPFGNDLFCEEFDGFRTDVEESGKAGGFQLVEESLHLLRTAEERDFVFAAECFRSLVGVGIFVIVDVGDLLTGGNTSAHVGKDAENAFETDGEAARGDLFADKFADEVVIASAARNRALELVTLDFEDRTGVVPLTADEGDVEVDGIVFVGECRCVGDNGLKVCGKVVANDGGYIVDGQGEFGEDVLEFRDGVFVEFLRAEFFDHTFDINFVEFVEANADGGKLFFREAALEKEGVEDFAVVDLDGERADIEAAERLGGDSDKFGFAVGIFVTDHVDVALDEFAETSLLRLFGTVDFIELDALEGELKLRTVGGIIAGQGEREVVTKTHVTEIVARFHGFRELFAALEDFEDEVEVVAAVALVEVFDVFDGGGHDAAEAVFTVAREDGLFDVFS